MIERELVCEAAGTRRWKGAQEGGDAYGWQLGDELPWIGLAAYQECTLRAKDRRFRAAGCRKMVQVRLQDAERFCRFGCRMPNNNREDCR